MAICFYNIIAVACTDTIIYMQLYWHKNIGFPKAYGLAVIKIGFPAVIKTGFPKAYGLAGIKIGFPKAYGLAGIKIGFPKVYDLC